MNFRVSLGRWISSPGNRVKLLISMYMLETRLKFLIQSLATGHGSSKKVYSSLPGHRLYVYVFILKPFNLVPLYCLRLSQENPAFISDMKVLCFE